MNRVRNGELPWTKLDDLHRIALDELAQEFGLDDVSEAELKDFNFAWRRLLPWPDMLAGLNRLVFSRNVGIIPTIMRRTTYMNT